LVWIISASCLIFPNRNISKKFVNILFLLQRQDRAFVTVTSRLMLLDKLTLLNVRFISNTQINCVDREESVLKELVLTKATVLEG
jgi:hypothetical protein